MERTLDVLLRRDFKASKFKTIVKLAVSRDAIMKNQRQARYSYARSDVIQLLTLGHHERALLRAEYVIKEENMLDVLIMIENYCHLLIERVTLFQKNKECPEELREAVSSLIFASSRCGEFPELLKIREMLTMRFGKEFAARAIELSNNCAVNPKIVQKLSSRRPSLESRLKVIKEISADIGITLRLEEDVLAAVKEPKQEKPNESVKFGDAKLGDDPQRLSMEFGQDDKLSESVKTRKKYRDVAAAALDAFESAAYAAVAARAAIHLSRSESQDYDSDDDGGSSHQQSVGSESYKPLTPDLQSDKYAVIEGDEGSTDGLEFDESHPVDNLGSESGGKDLAENSDEIHAKELAENERNAGRSYIMKQFPGSESENDEEENEVAPEEDDKDTEKNEDNRQWQTHDDLDSNKKPSLPMMTHENIRVNDGDDHQCLAVEEIDNKHSHPSRKLDSPGTKEGPKIKAMERKYRMTNTQSLNFRKQLHEQHSNADWKQFSMRTVRAQRI